ncbi:hypothetical protein SBA4_970022 [Candidatus Sulfopaludibacter sp. SbA4]|nr:hypothetical protein SBA4_970022 [Candidatus Sulfopaludibacter sp. SbA4]
MIAVVTGASRGVGRGAAIGLAEAGFHVFATGRNIDSADLPDGVVRIRCDHLRDEETASHAARLMAPRRRGLIVNIGFWAAQKHLGNVIYGVSKAATDKMTADMAHELRPHGVAVVSLYPGLVRTEAVMAAAAGGWLDLSNSESPEFIGRVVAALANRPSIMESSGKVLVAAAVAEELGVRDIDGKQPRPLTLETV